MCSCAKALERTHPKFQLILSNDVSKTIQDIDLRVLIYRNDSFYDIKFHFHELIYLSVSTDVDDHGNPKTVKTRV